MFLNYLKIAFRILWNNKLYSFINILGLSIAISVVLLIAIYVSFELNVDKSHPDYKNTYRVTTDIIDSPWTFAKTFPGLGPVLKENYHEIKDFTRLHEIPEGGLTVIPEPDKDTKFIEKKVYYADSNIYDFFDINLIKGNPGSSLTDAHSVIISTKLAEKFYGTDWENEPDLIGSALKLNDALNSFKLYKITGIFNSSTNSHFRPDILISINSLVEWQLNALDNFGWPRTYTYIKINPEADLDYLKDQIDSICHENAWAKNFDFDNEIQPLSDIYFTSNHDDELEAGGNLQLNYFLIGVALFIMICAWVNYINMAIAKSINRAKESGVRKTLGANRVELIFQYLLEGFWLNVVAGVIAVNLTVMGLPFLKNYDLLLYEGWPLKLWLNGNPDVLLFFLLVATLIITGTLLSGLYPAIIMSSYNPVKVFQGVDLKFKGKLTLRQFLLSLQFVISALLIIGIFAAFAQLNYMMNKNLGFDKEQKLIISTGIDDINTVENYVNRARILKMELSEIRNIQEVTTSSSVPGKPPYGQRVLSRIADASVFGEDIAYNGGPSMGLIVGPNFFDFYNIKLKAGRWFPETIYDDTTSINKYILVNKKFATDNGFEPPESVVGKTIWGQYKADEREPIEVLGMVENHHHYSVKENYIPLVFTPEGATKYRRWSGERTYHNGSMKTFSLNIQLGQQPKEEISRIISEIEELYKHHFPELAFEYYFLDDAFNDQYQADIQLSKTFGISAALSIFISCLGLFGLSSFLIQQRTKEIGIRKVLGASLKSLFVLLSKNYIRLVVLAGIISIPIAWWGIQRWLENYAFRIEISWWFFVAPLLVLLAIAIMTISIKILRTVRANPAEELRYE